MSSRASTGSQGEADLAALLQAERDALGRACDLQQSAARGTFRYLACGDAGLWVVAVLADGRLELVTHQDLQGFVGALFERDGQLWAEVRQVKAHPVAQLDTGAFRRTDRARAPTSGSPPPSEPVAPRTPAAPPLTASRDAERPPPPTGRVVEIGAGTVVVDLGARNGLTTGQHVALFEDVSEEVGVGHEATRTRLLAVGEVSALADARAQVALGIGERVPLGARAAATDRPLTTSSVAPPRPGEVWDVGFLARPFIALDTLGGGLLADAWVGKRFAAPVHLQARIAPFGAATADEGSTVPLAAYLLASYDVDLFEAGLGVGGETVHVPGFGVATGSGLSVVQFVRLGALDGLNLTAYTHVVLFHQEFDFSSLRLSVQIPLGGRSWLLLGGGGGTVGMAYGEAGLRTLLTGNGGAGSLFLTGVVGGALLYEEQQCFTITPDAFGSCVGREINYGGPMVGVGAEWRF